MIPRAGAEGKVNKFVNLQRWFAVLLENGAIKRSKKLGFLYGSEWVIG